MRTFLSGTRESRVARHVTCGNAIDWTTVEPEIFAGSAIKDINIPSVEPWRVFTTGHWKPGTVKTIGLENPEAVWLTMAKNVPADVKSQIEELRQKIIRDEIEISTEYDGPEVAP